MGLAVVASHSSALTKWRLSLQRLKKVKAVSFQDTKCEVQVLLEP
jgi:hypothetical protein